MTRIGLAFRLFLRTLFNSEFAGRARQLFDLAGAPQATAAAAPAPRPAPSDSRASGRSEALSLLAALQREARLIDFLQEPIDGYSDEQIGAAVRDVHRDAAAALQRMFGPRPLLEKPEGQPADVPTGFDAGRIRLVGNVTGTGPYRGTIRHAGWIATQAAVPQWTGSSAAQNVIAPAEIEV